MKSTGRFTFALPTGKLAMHPFECVAEFTNRLYRSSRFPLEIVFEGSRLPTGEMDFFRFNPVRHKNHFILIVVSRAKPAPVSVRIATRIERALSLMEQLVVGVTVAGNEIVVRVVGPISVDVVHFGPATKEFPHCALDHENMHVHLRAARMAVDVYLNISRRVCH